VSDQKIIFSMVGVGKVHKPNIQVLKDIYLSFFYGAKIGVLGLNGAGKSTLLRIIAGIDKDYLGTIQAQKGVTFGYLPQEPELDPDKTVREIVEEGVQDTVDLIKRYEAISEAYSDPDADYDKLMAEQGQLQEQIDHLGCLGSGLASGMAMDALRCPPGETPIRVLSGGEKRRVALCRLLLQKPDILLLDEPTNHLDAETIALAGAASPAYAGTVIAVTHDRYFLDNVAGWILELDRGHGHPVEGNYSSWLDQKRSGWSRRRSRSRSGSGRSSGSWSGFGMSPKGRQAKGKARISAYEKPS
jgi:energy-dependent translational throttle protein EttA